jgi:hypothetical protein
VTTFLLSYQNRRFASTDHAAIGEYRQRDDMVWATFAGGPVRAGRLVGRCDDAGVITAGYCQMLDGGRVLAGTVVSTPRILPDGRIELTEHWHRTDGTSGVSVIAEIGDPL